MVVCVPFEHFRRTKRRSFGELSSEIDRTRGMAYGAFHRQVAMHARDARTREGADSDQTSYPRRLAGAQSALASLLTSVVAPSATEVAPFAIESRAGEQMLGVFAGSGF